MIDRNFTIINGFPDTLGMSLTGKNFREILAFFKNSEQLIEIFSERLRDLIKGEPLVPFEFFLKTKDGIELRQNLSEFFVTAR